MTETILIFYFITESNIKYCPICTYDLFYVYEKNICKYYFVNLNKS